MEKVDERMVRIHIVHVSAHAARSASRNVLASGGNRRDLMDKSTDYEEGYRDGYNVGHKDGVDVGRCAKESAGRLVHDSDGAGYEDWLYKDVGKQSPTSD